jgi:hypothetical protein
MHLRERAGRPRTPATVLLGGVLFLLLAAFSHVPAAQASFGFKPGAEGFAVTVTDAGVMAPGEQPGAGEHPDALAVKLALRSAGEYSDGDLRNLQLDLPPGFLVNPTATEECTALAFHTPRSSPYEASASGENCPLASQVGTITVRSGPGGATMRRFGLFDLAPPYGVPGAIGASPYGVPVVLTPRVREADAGFTFGLEGLSQGIDFQSLELTIWGTPWDYGHDGERGNCLNETNPAAHYGTLLVLGPPVVLGTCSVGTPEFFENHEHSYLTLPTTPCGTPLGFAARAGSWQGGEAAAAAQALDGEGHAVVLHLCRTHLTIPKAKLTTERAASGTGLVFNLDVNDGGGILNPGGIARPAIRNAVVTLPEGVTINPSLGSGLGICSEAEFARESVDSAPGAGCPNASKIGTVEAQGMLGLPEPLRGSVFLAAPHANPFGDLIALYMVARNQRRGLFVRSQGTLVPDPHSGALVATFQELPRLLYTHFTLTLREGQRAALVSPPTCGHYPTDVALASWATPDAFDHDSTSYVPISQSAAGGSCPAALRPFAPGLQAGSRNPAAAAYTPFDLHMTRTDSEQEITSYSATFPPGLTGKLAAVATCPDAALEAAKGRTGAEELASPSCPAQSQVGHTLAGYGVGGALAWAPGGLYLAGPYHGAPLSIVAVDSAIVGPFDLGVVVVRSAIRIDRRTAQVSIDSSGSDPIPHILDGIPLHLRDIRVYVDRPGFTLNPTSCDVLSTRSALTGSGADPFSPADDVSAGATQRYQLLGCSGLGFKPQLALKLSGGARRGQHPALRATYTPRPGDANIGTAVVALPHGEFLAQNHIREICQAAQFEADRCPPTSVYGRARAFSPLLAQPLEGPVYLKASSHRLPDMVAALRGDGGIAIDVEGRIDSFHGGMRGSFEVLPDAPVSKFVLTLDGGKRGLLENSESLCAAPTYAGAQLSGHNNAAEALKVKVGNDCRKGGRGKGHRGRRGQRR